MTADEREAVAYHEAAHAVMACVVGQPFRYITMRPRDPKSAAHVVFPPSTPKAWKRGEWRDFVLISFAGIIAQDLFFDAPGSLEGRRRRLTQHDGRDDLTYARDILRAAWARNRKDPKWSAAPIYPEHSPLDMAIQAWDRAAYTTLMWVEAIAGVADELLASRRALPSSAVWDVVESADQRMVHLPLPDHLSHPWFLDHTRLQWMPSERWVERATAVAA